jgi:hypothetical protein
MKKTVFVSTLFSIIWVNATSSLKVTVTFNLSLKNFLIPIVWSRLSVDSEEKKPDLARKLSSLFNTASGIRRGGFFPFRLYKIRASDHDLSTTSFKVFVCAKGRKMPLVFYQF